MRILRTSYLAPLNKRILVVTGHFGSGKTEFSVSLALLLAAEIALPWRHVALVDLDIANPYFRSRERRELLEKAGVALYGSAYHDEITAELPALGADVRAPLEDKDCFVIVDAGGNDSGARVLHQFRKYFQCGESQLATVVNANRPETRDATGALYHLQLIENELQMKIDCLINNTHLLRDTSPDDVTRGHELCMELCCQTGKSLLCDCYPDPLLNAGELIGVGEYLLPLGMHMRQSYLDK